MTCFPHRRLKVEGLYTAAINLCAAAGTTEGESEESDLFKDTKYV